MKEHYQRRSAVTGKEHNPIEEPRYLGVPTFMRTPYATSLEGLEIGLVGVPFDGGATNRPGARHGPREIRNQSSNVRTIHPVFGVSPFDQCKVADVGDVSIENLFDLEAAHDEIAGFFSRLRSAGVVPLSAGGDHSISYPILRGLAGETEMGLIQVDAHTDTWDAWRGSRSHHGSPFRLAVEDRLIDPRRTIQIGIRGPQTDPGGWDYSREVGMRVLYMQDVEQIGIDEVIVEARRTVGDGPTYLTFDIDGLDPAFAPGTGTPEIGGLTTREALRLLRGLRGLDFVGADVVEVSPPFDHTGTTALVGSSIMYELLCLLTDAVVARKPSE